MQSCIRAAGAAGLLLLGGTLVPARTVVRAGDATAVLGEPVLEPPTLRSLGVYWTVRGDDNANARVAIDYRAQGSATWKAGPALFRVERGAHRPGQRPSKIDVPADGWLFAGSAVFLQPDTAYELRLRLEDPDGGSAERLLTARTLAKPVEPPGLRTFHVAPGSGGGAGTAADPFRGLAAAQAQARPGTLFLVHAGVYPAPFPVSASGEPGRPVIWRGAGDGEAAIDGAGGNRPAPRVVEASGAHDVWLEGLTIRGGDYGLVANEAARLVVRRCRIAGVRNGIVATRNETDAVRGFVITDNEMEGPFTWPPTEGPFGAGAEEYRGIQITGTGHVVAYNRIRHFKDGIDTFPSPRCAAIDFHNNEIGECVDDGIELDFSERNVRCFENRLTNVFQGISTQPVYGGPVYVFRNALYNVHVEPFKLHNSPSGVLLIHNTIVKHGGPFLVWTPAAVHHCVTRNNLFVGSGGPAAVDITAPMVDCDFDYDGFGGGPWPLFLRWHRERFATLEEARARAPVYRHAVVVDSSQVFASSARPPEDPKRPSPALDLRLRPGTSAIDAGEPLPGFSDGYAGKGPDLGAYELGAALPQYGPRVRIR